MNAWLAAGLSWLALVALIQSFFASKVLQEVMAAKREDEAFLLTPYSTAIDDGGKRASYRVPIGCQRIHPSCARMTEPCLECHAECCTCASCDPGRLGFRL
jgi:hypothetical protein